MNTVEKQMFLGIAEVRVVNKEWIVLKDMFGALGRVKEDGGWDKSKIKMMDFLEDIGKLEDSQELRVSSKSVKSKSRETQTVDCLKLETAPIVLTQFRPINSNRRTEEENKQALETWREFMKFVNDLLVSLGTHKFIITDIDKHKTSKERLNDAGGKHVIAENQVNIIMAKLLGVYGKGIKKIAKYELKNYQHDIVVDLLIVREFVYDKFVNAYEFTGSHSKSAELALNLALEKFNLL